MGRAVWAGAWIALAAAGFMSAARLRTDSSNTPRFPFTSAAAPAARRPLDRGDRALPDAVPRHHNGPEAVCEDCHLLHVSKSPLRIPELRVRWNPLATTGP